MDTYHIQQADKDYQHDRAHPEVASDELKAAQEVDCGIR
jgi:hypothetical protein